MARPNRFSPEARDRAVRMVLEHQDERASRWAAITSIAEKIGCTAETLRSRVRQAEWDAGRRPRLTTEGRARLKQLERENGELRRANEILREASAYFAQAEFLWLAPADAYLAVLVPPELLPRPDATRPCRR